MTSKSGGDSDPVNEEYLGNVTEVGTQAVWSLSSCKPGNNQLNIMSIITNLKKTISLKVLVLNNYVIIVWIHIGNQMDNYHT